MAENRTKIWKYSRKKVKWEFSLTRDSIFLTRKNEITHPLCVFFLQKIHKICTGQNKIVSLEKISSQRFNYERMDLDYEGINRNVFPFFQEAETSVSFFCLILFLLSKETGEQGMFSQGRTFSNYTIGNWGWAKTPVLPYICLSCQKVHDGFPEDVLGSVKTGVYHLFFWGISITVLWGLSLESREVETTGRSLFPWPTRPTPCSCNI